MANETKLGFDGQLTCAIECADLDKTVAWYQEVLGFQLMYKVEEIAWAELSTSVDGVSLGVGQVESPQVKGGATLTWGVIDIDTARDDIASHGVRFDGETQTIPGMVRLATFFDPDGNRHMLAQDLTKEGEPC